MTLFYAGIGLALLAPGASDSVLPSSDDLPDHLGAIVQARMALQEGQFPLRVAPWQDDGWQYPFYQFYASLPYTVAGSVHQWLTPDNPWVAFKLTIWLLLTSAGIFIYRLAFWLTGCRPSALLAGALYACAPYFLINIHARGNFTESFAQGILPVVIFYSARCFATPRLPTFPRRGCKLVRACGLTHHRVRVQLNVCRAVVAATARPSAQAVQPPGSIRRCVRVRIVTVPVFPGPRPFRGLSIDQGRFSSPL